MPKRTKTDFADFKRYFKEYQRKFGLAGYRVYFKHKRLDDCYANIFVRQDDMMATVTLNSKLNGKDSRNLKSHAKHEASHLLIARLGDMSRYRYVTKEQLDEAEEELVNKLVGLIK